MLFPQKVNISNKPPVLNYSGKSTLQYICVSVCNFRRSCWCLRLWRHSERSYQVTILLIIHSSIAESRKISSDMSLWTVSSSDKMFIVQHCNKVGPMETVLELSLYGPCWTVTQHCSYFVFLQGEEDMRIQTTQGRNILFPLYPFLCFGYICV